MSKKILFILAGLVQAFLTYAQTDSIVTFQDIRFHSVFEEKAFNRFVQHQTDTLDAFLAVDDLLNADDFSYLNKKFEDIFRELTAKKIEAKKTNAQIKLA
jgi:hypothetical protein